MSEPELETMVLLFKALADPNRLRILGILGRREASVEELAAMLGLKSPTVSHHLSKLRNLELITMRREGTTHLYSLHADGLHSLSRRILSPGTLDGLADEVEGDAWTRRTLRSFVSGETLKQIPVSRQKLLIILGWLAADFESDTDYPEAEVNRIIARHHPDYATLRRMLVGYGFMTRNRGVYRRSPDDQSRSD